MINPHDFDGLLSHSVYRHIGRGRKQKLSRSVLASDTATLRQLFQRPDSLIQLAHGGLPVIGVVLFEVITDALQVRSGG